jgi:hypothetical protein
MALSTAGVAAMADNDHTGAKGLSLLSRIKQALLNLLTAIPDRIDAFIRILDAAIGSTGSVPRFYGRSPLAFILPLAVSLFIILGPCLTDTDGALAWHGGWKAALLLAGAVALQAVYFLQNRWRGMAWLHFGMVGLLTLATWLIAGAEATQASGRLYRHYYGLLAFAAIIVAVPIAGWLRRRALFALPSAIITEFYQHFDAGRVAAKGSPRSLNIWDILDAFVLAVLQTPLHVCTPVAFVVLAAGPGHLWLWAILALLLSLILFAMGSYDPERNTFVRMVQRAFLSGGSLVVTLVILALAILRLAGVDYVTTILDTSSKLIVFSYILSTYALFWLYDLWVNQAVLDLLGDLNRFRSASGFVQRHGGGRIAVTATGDKTEIRMFEPALFLKRIARTAPEPDQASLYKEASRAALRFRAFTGLSLTCFGLLLLLAGLYLHRLDQSPGLTVKNQDASIYDLSAHLISSDTGPVVMLAASGGGTRAALYTASVLHGLARLGRLDHLILTSGVSGGSAALAYFAIHRPALLHHEPDDWRRMRETLAAPFIQDVLSGAAEWRVVSRVRLGQLLTESFRRRFLATETSAQIAARTTLGAVTDLGLIFNTSLCGSPPLENSSQSRESALQAGGRLAITNLSSNFDMQHKPAAHGWPLDLPFVVVHAADVSLFPAASLSANFPPVFSNAGVALDGRPYWVTDGGAVENRGLISILLTLSETLEKIQARDPTVGRRLADIRIIVADASAFQPEYKSDRGIGAKFGAAEQLANRLIKELFERAGKLHQAISGRAEGIRFVHLPMPAAMRAAGTFGTHWMMPPSVTLKDPLSGDISRPGIELDQKDLQELIDVIYSKTYTISYIQQKWPQLDAAYLMQQTGQPWDVLQAGLE